MLTREELQAKIEEYNDFTPVVRSHKVGKACTVDDIYLMVEDLRELRRREKLLMDDISDKTIFRTIYRKFKDKRALKEQIHHNEDLIGEKLRENKLMRDASRYER